MCSHVPFALNQHSPLGYEDFLIFQQPVKGDKTVSELARQYGVHPTLIHGWKKLLLANAEMLFANGSKGTSADAEADKAELFEQIGRLKMELEWLKKTVGSFT